MSLFEPYSLGEPLLRAIKKAFGGPIIVCGDPRSSEGRSGAGGRLRRPGGVREGVHREPGSAASPGAGSAAQHPDVETFYAGGDNGYADYPALP